MKKFTFLIALTLLISSALLSQVGINTETPDNSAILDVSSTTKGFLTPRMTMDQRDAIVSPADGLMVFCSNCGVNGALSMYSNGLWRTFLSVALPAVTTVAVTNITKNSATSGGNVTSDGGEAVSTRGVCWSTSPNPTTANSKTIDGGGIGIFISNLTSLSAGTLYYVRAYAISKAGTAYGNELSFTTTPNAFTIGQSYGGGIIFYLDGTAEHGLICSADDIGNYPMWGCFPGNIGGTHPGIGFGQANTTLIVNACGEGGIAARLCNDLVLNGYSDWFLPSVDELFQIYLQRSAIGAFSSGGYWSSTEMDFMFAYYVDFNSGSTMSTYKGANESVRAVRSF